MTSTPQSTSTSPDIPFHGLVETTGDALRLIQAARQGLIPRITRRLNEDERGTIIRSGAVFIFSVQESGIRRWTEGLSWSASRIAGNFLLYRELTSRNNGRTSYTGKALSTESAFSRRRLVPRDQEHQPTFKPGGLIKKTITVAADGTHYHLISYYTDDDVRTRRLQRPSARLDIMAQGIPSDLLDASNFRYPPRIDIGPNGSVVNIRDADEIETFPITDSPPSSSSSQQNSTLSSLRGIGAETDSSGFLLRSSRRPREIRPAKAHSPESTPPPRGLAMHSASESYVPSIRTEGFSVALPSSSSFQGMPTSPVPSFSGISPGSPSAPRWHEEPSNFGANTGVMPVEGYGNDQMLMDQFDTVLSSSAPHSSYSFTETMMDRRDITRTHSYPSTSSLHVDNSTQSAYYNPQHVTYQQPHSAFYPANYDPRIPYSTSGYYGPFINDER